LTRSPGRDHEDVPLERVLVNFFYAHPVGHVVEALHYCLGHHMADRTREIAVALNAATAVELAGFCPFISETYAIDHPLLEPCTDSARRLAGLPRRWDWVLDDFRRRQDLQHRLWARRAVRRHAMARAVGRALV
jgi:hypothetical protein